MTTKRVTNNYTATHESWLMRCLPRAQRFSQSNLHACQNLIFMSSFIHKVGLPCKCSFFKNVWLSLSTCYCGPTSLLNVRVCFPSFHNGLKNITHQSRDPQDGKMNVFFEKREFYLLLLHARLNINCKAWSYKKKRRKGYKRYSKAVQKEPIEKSVQ